MIKLKMSIEDINEYQTGILPENAVKIEIPQSIDEMMKKAAPIAVILCVLMFATMLCKTIVSKTVVEELEAAKKEVEKVTGEKPISQKMFKAI